ASPTADNPAAGEMQALAVLARYALAPSSGLYRRLVVEEQKVDQLFSYFPDRYDPYLLSVMARVKDPADAAYVRDAILETFATMRTRTPDPTRIAERSEERRVGKECRSRWWAARWKEQRTQE